MAVALQALDAAADRELLVNMLKHVGQFGMLGAGLGAGFRGIQGLQRVRGDLAAQPTESAFPTLPIRRPAPRPRQKEERDKQAAGGSIVKQVGEGAQDLGSKLLGYFTAPWNLKNLSSHVHHPAFLPGAALAGGAGLYGGWKLSDMLLDRASQATSREELEKAKQDYELALSGQLAHPSGRRPLDALAKQAMTPTDATGSLQGIMGLLMGASALGTGKITYDLVRKRQRPELIEKARRQKLRELSQSRSIPILLEPPTLQPR